MVQIFRTYSELIKIPTFKERYEYLKLDGSVGSDTFGSMRYLNQRFYTSLEWKRFKTRIVARDLGCEMAHMEYPIKGRIILHHLEPLVVEDFTNITRALMNEENVVCVSHILHNAIHYGDFSLLPQPVVERTPNDTSPWKN